MENRDFTNIEERKAVVKELNESLLKDLVVLGIKLHENVVVFINRNTVVISIMEDNKMLSGSDIVIYRNDLFEYAGVEISFYGGSFDPSNNVAHYWKTITAADILKNWDAVVLLVKEYCAKYEELCIEFMKANNVKSSFEK